MKNIKETFEIVSIEELSFYNQLISEDELTEKKIKKIEAMIRGSYEYKNYIQYLKDELDITKCSFIEGIDKNEISSVTLEFHHTPLTLYDIVEIIAKYLLDTRLDEELKISNFDIAKLVVKEHYLGNIGLVPLTKTSHELAHSNAIVIPREKIYGNYNEFIQNYRKYIPDHTMTKVYNLIKYRNEDELNKINNKFKDITISKIAKD